MITTDINFPSELPNALVANHNMKSVQPFVRTTMDSGRARQRRRFSSVPVMLTAQWNMNDQQGQLFEAWFRDAINDGADWFNFQYRTPMGLQMLVCRFVEMYEGPNLVDRLRWSYTAQLEAYERALLPPGWGNFPDWIRYMDIFDIAMNREWPEA